MGGVVPESPDNAAVLLKSCWAYGRGFSPSQYSHQSQHFLYLAGKSRLLDQFALQGAVTTTERQGLKGG